MKLWRENNQNAVDLNRMANINTKKNYRKEYSDPTLNFPIEPEKGDINKKRSRIICIYFNVPEHPIPI